MLQRTIIVVLYEVFYFPLWWYGRGVKFIFLQAHTMIRFGSDLFSPALWWRYLFVPMYGQYNWQGRVISFIMRFVQGVVRGFLFILYVVVIGGIVVAWFVLPLVIMRGLLVGLFRFQI